MEPIRKVAFCPHCGNRAPQRHIYTQEYGEEIYDENGSEIPTILPCTYYVVVCETCDRILLYHDCVEIRNDNKFHLTRLIYPDPGVLHESIPKLIADCYTEAVKIKHLAPNAFAVQIRRALEAICEDRGAKERTLHDRLQHLAQQGEIPPILAEMTKVLRLLGNIGAHATDQSIQPGYVGAIDDFFRAIVEYVYVAPSKLTEFRDRLERLKTDAGE